MKRKQNKNWQNKLSNWFEVVESWLQLKTPFAEHLKRTFDFNTQVIYIITFSLFAETIQLKHRLKKRFFGSWRKSRRKKTVILLIIHLWMVFAVDSKMLALFFSNLLHWFTGNLWCNALYSWLRKVLQSFFRSFMFFHLTLNMHCIASRSINVQISHKDLMHLKSSYLLLYVRWSDEMTIW